MKKNVTTFCLLLLATLTKAQTVGMNCQYFPGLQVGFVSVKATNNAQFSKYRFGAATPLLMIDRITNRWYVNMDFNALYYAATQTNKANDDRIKISKAEGGLYAGRVGYMFGEKDDFRFGVNGNIGFLTSNLDSIDRPLKQRGYINYGLGVLAYKKIGKFRAVAKVGYELYRKKNFITKGSGFYLEGTLGYSFFQKYGLSVMPCFYSKKFDYIPLAEKSAGTMTEAKGKVRSFVLRVGLTKFF
ncbi:MAG: hypothetical protein V4635_16685 [Bacteroidota bacterium]